MITCRELAELLFDLLNGEVSEEQRRRLDDHLHICPPCVIYLETYRQTIQLSRQLPPQPLPDGLAQRLRLALDGVPRGPANP